MSDERALRTRVAWLSSIGLAASLYSIYEHVLLQRGDSSAAAVCTLSRHFDCAAVNSSQFSVIAGIPLGSYGTLYYIVLLAIGLFAGRSGGLSEKTAASIVLALSGIASLASMALFAISEFVIGAICLVCVIIYLVNFLTFLAARRLGSGNFSDGLVQLLTSPRQLARSDAQGRTARLLLIPTVLLAVLLAVVPRILILSSPPVPPSLDQGYAAWKATTRQTISLELDRGSFGDYAEGPTGAPIQIVEFADFECPGCRRFSLQLKSLRDEFSGQIQFIYKNYPLDNACNPNIPQEFHRLACFSAALSRCAGEQGAFWKALEFLFTYEGIEEGATPDEIRDALARSAELDQEALQACMDSKRHEGKIRSDIAEGDRLGLQSTPSLWINGKYLDVLDPNLLRHIFRRIIDHKE